MLITKYLTDDAEFIAGLPGETLAEKEREYLIRLWNLAMGNGALGGHKAYRLLCAARGATLRQSPEAGPEQG